MASLSKQANGRWRVQYLDAGGKRQGVRFGPMNQLDATEVKRQIEHLAVAKITGRAVKPETARWVDTLSPRMAKRLEKAGLIDPKEPEVKPQEMTLEAFLDEYIAGRKDVKPQTTVNLKHAQRYLIDHFGPGKLLRDITPGDADQFRIAMKGRLSENTARRHCGRAKQFFRAAARRKLIAENPFADMKGCAVRSNPGRMYFVTSKEAARVLEACPDHEWQLLFALARFGGLRTPSESLRLRWQDVDWEHGRMLVHSPKTEHHEGGESRVIPIFPELRPYLEAAWDAAEPGATWIITRYRGGGKNLRTQLKRIVERAGLKAWPKLWQNCRSTRETELAEVYPVHVVCSWIGNTAAVAAKHYLQVTDDHFAQAIGQEGAPNGKMVQKMVQQPAAEACLESQTVATPQSGQQSAGAGNVVDCKELRPVAIGCDNSLGDNGLRSNSPTRTRT